MENFTEVFFKSLFAWQNLKWLLIVAGVAIVLFIVRILVTKFERKVDNAIDKHLVKKEVCPKCGGKLVEKHGKYGDFIGCSNYPKCRYTHDVIQNKDN